MWRRLGRKAAAVWPLYAGLPHFLNIFRKLPGRIAGRGHPRPMPEKSRLKVARVNGRFPPYFAAGRSLTITTLQPDGAFAVQEASAASTASSSLRLALRQPKAPAGVIAKAL